MSKTYEIESASVQVVDVEVKTPADPTGANPSFSFTSRDSSDPGAFTPGTWAGSYDAATDVVVGSTPTCGAAAATIDLTGAEYWRLWIKWVVGSETVVKNVGLVRVT